MSMFKERGSQLKKGVVKKRMNTLEENMGGGNEDIILHV